MSEVTLTETRIADGVWQGVLRTPQAEAPALAAFHGDRPLPSPEVTADRGDGTLWLVRVPIPPEVLNDGLQSVIITEAASGEVLASCAIAMGEGLDQDLRAEVSLLRAELDMLKRAFRRHCVEAHEGGA
ncbi:hypothetical protein SAMN04490244_10964 [Tranquillimonas rosea]|uniref:Uncharacterized protein n=1 Tax=Tranquillimonas rosea TaxID=641238 RepID=A0A1H9W3G1_9RHOB|nr:hypothetical protein SAMN04490244_10964 [Tranquillimonas rosea]